MEKGVSGSEKEKIKGRRKVGGICRKFPLFKESCFGMGGKKKRKRGEIAFGGGLTAAIELKGASSSCIRLSCVRREVSLVLANDE